MARRSGRSVEDVWLKAERTNEGHANIDDDSAE
jgi:hypothetical protein